MSKSIVITGASKGIGRASADALFDQDWSVIGVARRSPRCFPGVFIEADLADQNQTETLAKDLGTRGNVLGIVNNVGLAKQETFDDVQPNVFTAIMDLNVRPALQLTQALLPGMRSARFGRIINVTRRSPMTTEEFRARIRQGALESSGIRHLDHEQWANCEKLLFYMARAEIGEDAFILPVTFLRFASHTNKTAQRCQPARLGWSGTAARFSHPIQRRVLRIVEKSHHPHLFGEARC